MAVSVRKRIAVAAVVAGVVAGACGDGEDGASEQDVVDAYAEGVHAMYSESLESARAMDEAIDAFVADPTADTLDAAKQAWLTARDDYGPTEAFRFYGGPIDDEETGVEGLVNAWPLDEAYIDYVEGAPEAGIVNSPDEHPTIDAETLVAANEQGGEANVSTGWHAIEFLLWGQDLSADGPGARPIEDYTTNPNADRRAVYLATTSDLLLEHLEGLVAAWAPDEDGNYRSEFVALDPAESLAMIITGIGELSSGELAGERMSVAYEERSQEDEHSCFADNTTSDIVANASGIGAVVNGDYGDVTGPGLADLLAGTDEALSEELVAAVEESTALAEAIPAPFDQHLGIDVPDDDPGRQSILATIESLQAQAEVIAEAATALGIELGAG
jgi:putative iron-regulated protein